MATEASRCTGHCCKDFDLEFPPEMIARWQKYTKLGKPILIDRGRYPQRVYDEDTQKVSEMVVYLRTDQQSARTKKGRKNLKFSRLHHYTCKYFDKSTGNCLNYDNRPKMCKEFPYSDDPGPCGYKGCTRTCQ